MGELDNFNWDAISHNKPLSSKKPYKENSIDDELDEIENDEELERLVFGDDEWEKEERKNNIDEIIAKGDSKRHSLGYPASSPTKSFEYPYYPKDNKIPMKSKELEEVKRRVVFVDTCPEEVKLCVKKPLKFEYHGDGEKTQAKEKTPRPSRVRGLGFKIGTL